MTGKCELLISIVPPTSAAVKSQSTSCRQLCGSALAHPGPFQLLIMESAEENSEGWCVHQKTGGGLCMPDDHLCGTSLPEVAWQVSCVMGGREG